MMELSQNTYSQLLFFDIVKKDYRWLCSSKTLHGNQIPNGRTFTTKELGSKFVLTYSSEHLLIRYFSTGLLVWSWISSEVW